MLLREINRTRHKTTKSEGWAHQHVLFSNYVIMLFVSLLFTNQSIANDKIESMYNKCTSYIKIVNFGLENTSTDEKINFIECIKQSDNNMFFNAVVTLTSIAKSSSFDARIFKSMDKVCQMIYHKHKENQG